MESREIMAKIDLYCDVWQGAQPKDVYFMKIENLTQKMDNTKRFKVTVNIPDYAFEDHIDGHGVVEEVKEVDK